MVAQGDGGMNARVADLFHQLADLSPEERSRYLAEHEIDDETRKEAERLLAFDSRDSAPLLRNIGLAAEGMLSRLDALGRRCGPYRLLRVLGRGGMGVVYLAERVDGEVSQRAAVKLLQPGLQDTQRERFLQEREILAALTHPNIAHLLDAGRLEDGQPFLAMEYVEGQAIDVFTAGLGIRRKITLFLKVCAAVGYLHRNLIVHRDLKPGNIVVTQEGEPKLLDFGIAKILDLATDHTVTGMRMLTPDYASPEQLMGERAGTTSDIFSLGAVLYLLLTGKPPHRSEEGSPAAVTLSRREITRPSKWAPAIKGDLELILMKALRWEPQDRYQTVQQMADDLEAYLELRPIRARRGDLVYRARKVARKYWLPLSGATLAVAGLVVGLYVANRERAVAQRRFDEVRRLSNKLFDIDRRVLALPGNSRTRQLIVDTSLDYLRRLATDVEGDLDLALDMGTAYMRVGRVQGVPISPNLGQPDDAEQNLRIAERLIHSVLAARPDNATAMLRAAQIAHDRMVLAESRRPDTGALPLARESERWLEKYLSSGRADHAEMNQVSLLGANIANWYVRKDLMTEALSLLKRTIDVVRAANQPEQASRAYLIMARALRSTGDLDGALAATREGVIILEALPPDIKQGWALNVGLILETQGEILGEDNAISLGRPQEAAEYFERTYRLALDWAQRDPDDSLSRFAVFGRGIRLAGVRRHSDPRGALSIYDEVLRRLAEVENNPRARRSEVMALAASTYPLRKMGRFNEARSRLDAAFSRLAGLKLYPAEQVTPGSEADHALRARAELQAGTGRIQLGIETYRQLLDRIMASEPKPESDLEDANDISNIYAAMTVLYRRAKLANPAAAMEGRRLDLWRQWDLKLPNNAFVRRQLAPLSTSPPAVP
jgi:predicted Ser/Thr protein kinase/tetratricopeptide (TPR) repeat protein